MGEVHSNDIEASWDVLSILMNFTVPGLNVPFRRMVIFSAELVLGPRTKSQPMGTSRPCREPIEVPIVPMMLVLRWFFFGWYSVFKLACHSNLVRLER